MRKKVTHRPILPKRDTRTTAARNTCRLATVSTVGTSAWVTVAAWRIARAACSVHAVSHCGSSSNNMAVLTGAVAYAAPMTIVERRPLGAT